MTQTPAQSAERPFHVLYVEDNPASRRLMGELFKTQPHLRLSCCESAEDGIELASIERPDLILMDINLPSIDGYQALGILRHEPRTAHIPVIAVTANAMLADIDRGKQAGFFDYLTKPLDLRKLLALVNDLASQRA